MPSRAHGLAKSEMIEGVQTVAKQDEPMASPRPLRRALIDTGFHAEPVQADTRREASDSSSNDGD
jgi:hypothetical protein